MATNHEIADVLDKAHDELLIRGFTKGDLVAEDGRVCSMGAIYAALDALILDEYSEWHGDTGVDVNPYTRALAETEGWDGGPDSYWATANSYVVNFNDDEFRTFDEILDAFKNTAKRLREL